MPVDTGATIRRPFDKGVNQASNSTTLDIQRLTNENFKLQQSVNALEQRLNQLEQLLIPLATVLKKQPAKNEDTINSNERSNSFTNKELENLSSEQCDFLKSDESNKLLEEELVTVEQVKKLTTGQCDFLKSDNAYKLLSNKKITGEEVTQLVNYHCYLLESNHGSELLMNGKINLANLHELGTRLSNLLKVGDELKSNTYQAHNGYTLLNEGKITAEQVKKLQWAHIQCINKNMCFEQLRDGSLTVEKLISLSNAQLAGMFGDLYKVEVPTSSGTSA